MMTSRERVRAAIRHQNPDRVPAAYGAVACVTEKLMKCYGFSEYSQLIDKFHIDIVSVEPCYIGPELKRYINSKGEEVKESYWGYETTMHKTETDVYPVVSYYPLSGIESKSDAEKFIVPDPDWFDYKSIKEQCCKYPDKAIITGHEGPFQQVTCLMNMEEFFVLMLEEPEVAKYILDKMVAFELEYYKRIFEAAEGRIDILRPHDDYGTQLSLLFSVDMWREFFEENTKKLVDLAHQYDVFYQQHSCGAVRELIPELIKCKVDVLEPIQKVKGLEPEELYQGFWKQKELLAYLEKHISAKLTLKDIAAAHHVSYYTLSRNFKRDTGMGLKKYMEILLLDRARKYLLMTDMQIQEVAGLLGFSDAFYFSRFFQQNDGRSPREFRKRMRGIF